MRNLLTPSKTSTAYLVLNPPTKGDAAAGGRIPPPRVGKDWWAARHNANRTGRGARAA